MRDISNHLRARLARLEQQQPDDQQRPIDWDLLAQPNAWDQFVASAGPPPPESEEKRASRKRLEQLCAEVGCTPTEIGLPDAEEIERYRAGLGPSPRQILSGTPAPQQTDDQRPIATSPEGETADERLSDE